MTIDLTKPEIDLIVALMDAGVKAAGLQAVKPDLVNIISKFATAVQTEAKTRQPAPMPMTDFLKEENANGND